MNILCVSFGDDSVLFVQGLPSNLGSTALWSDVEIDFSERRGADFR